jgi:hypothetical protein
MEEQTTLPPTPCFKRCFNDEKDIIQQPTTNSNNEKPTIDKRWLALMHPTIEKHDIIDEIGYEHISQNVILIYCNE